MANVFAIHSIGASLVTYLKNAYPASLKTDHPCDFQLVSSGQLAGMKDDLDGVLSLFLYRVTANEHLRNARRGNDPQDVALPLSLDLHYLLGVVPGALPSRRCWRGRWRSYAVGARRVVAVAGRRLDGGRRRAHDSGRVEQRDVVRIWDAVGPRTPRRLLYRARRAHRRDAAAAGAAGGATR
jgi:hypothetical protein